MCIAVFPIAGSMFVRGSNISPSTVSIAVDFVLIFAVAGGSAAGEIDDVHIFIRKHVAMSQVNYIPTN